jgi:hypothetical protein
VSDIRPLRRCSLEWSSLRLSQQNRDVVVLERNADGILLDASLDVRVLSHISILYISGSCACYQSRKGGRNPSLK